MSNVVQRNSNRFEATITSHEIEQIELQHKSLVDSYRAETSLRGNIDSFKDDTKYGKAWYVHSTVIRSAKALLAG